MSDEKTFVSGMRINRRENAPDFVIGQLGIKVDELVVFLEKHKNEKGWLNIDLKKSKGGKMYCELNTYKKEEAKVGAPVDENGEEIPF